MMDNFDHQIKTAFEALPPADVYLKNRLRNLPEERQAPRRRGLTVRRLVPLAAALAVVAVACIAIPQLSNKSGMMHEAAPPEYTNAAEEPVELPGIPYGSFIGEGAMGFEAHMNKSAAELHRDSPAYGREGEIGTMPVYRNPMFGGQEQLDEAAAREIAEKFGRAMGKTYVYVPPRWLAPEGQEQVREKLRAVGESEEEIEKQIREMLTQTSWEFKCGDEALTVNAWGGITLTVPMTGLPPGRITDPVRYESVCRQAYEDYAAAFEAVTGLRFNKASTAWDYNIYGEEHFQTFLYVNDPADTLVKQTEDYLLKRLDVTIPFASMAEEPDEVLTVWLHYDGSHSGAEELGRYPVMDLEGAKRALLAGHYEASVNATPQELARATVEEAELIYGNRPWLSAWMPMYRLYLTFAPGDMEDWGNSGNAHFDELGVRYYYVFYVPAVPPQYLVPQQEDANTPRPVY